LETSVRPRGIAGRRKHHWQKKINHRLTIADGEPDIRRQTFPGPVSPQPDWPGRKVS
jgi:hypothetical protein